MARDRMDFDALDPSLSTHPAPHGEPRESAWSGCARTSDEFAATRADDKISTGLFPSPLALGDEQGETGLGCDGQAARPPANAALLLQIWLSPSFPVGAFAYSHGLEQAAEAGRVTGAPELATWIGDLIAQGSIGNDLVLAAAAWRAIAAGDRTGLSVVAELGAAYHPSAERRLESVTQGGSFLDAAAAAWPCPAIAQLRAAAAGDIAYPVAVGAVAAGHRIALAPLLQAYATAFAGTLASAGIRLSLLGQTDAQRLLTTLMPAIMAAADKAAKFDLDDLGSAALSADLCSLEHETQYTRLFRS